MGSDQEMFMMQFDLAQRHFDAVSWHDVAPATHYGQPA